MFGFNINNQFLDLNQGTGITLNWHTPVYTGGDPMNIKTVYTLDVSIPNTFKNRKLLNYHRIGTSNDKIEDVLMYIEGVPLFKGTLFVDKANAQTMKVSFVSNVLKRLANNYVSDMLDNVVYNPYLMQESVTDWAYRHMDNPFRKDFAFFPVRNPGIEDQGAYNDSTYLPYVMNEYNDSDKFDANSGALTPFLRVGYVLQKIMDGNGIALNDEFFTSEWQDLFLFNNYNVWSVPKKNVSPVNLKNHVPKIKCNEFIKQLSTMFFISPFLDHSTGVIHLKRMKDVLSAPAVDDWTPYLTSITYGNSAKDLVNKYEYAGDDNDNGWSSPRTTDFITVSHIAEIPEKNNQWYYVSSSGKYYYNDGGRNPIEWFAPFKISDGDNVYQMKTAPMRTAINYPEINTPLTYYNDTEQKMEENACGMRVMFYRGFQPYANGNKTYPYGGVTAYNVRGERVGNRSLHLNGPDGIINSLGQEMVYFVSTTQRADATLQLPLRKLLQFKPWHKVTIKESNYMVSKITIKATPDGVQNVTAELYAIDI